MKKKLCFVITLLLILGHQAYARESLIEMRLIPGGTFTMGSNDPTDANARPAHTVTIYAFWMSRFLVTQAQYEAVMGTNPSGFIDPNRPVEAVSWFDAIVFCNLLSIMEGLSPAYEMETTTSGLWSTDPALWGEVPDSFGHANFERWNAVRVVPGSSGYRLPTEAQWEYACRAGTTTPFNTGVSINRSQANFNSHPGGNTSAVGSYAPNAWGLYDMHGNVWEWVWDWFAFYSSTPRTNPAVGPRTPAADGTVRVVRGGSWISREYGLRSAYRNLYNPWERSIYGNVGFRVVRPTNLWGIDYER
ncbi:MAG: formylglycine-generating enzyme family protein [Spirochaetes bacterium]|nr:formylglycine-generating enzyme family protein [Spirochaetota bacterium]